MKQNIKVLVAFAASFVVVTLVIVLANYPPFNTPEQKPTIASASPVIQQIAVQPISYSKTHKTPARIIHYVIYKEGEYPDKPEWMTQRQWDNYICWESNRQNAREQPRFDEDAHIKKVLRHVIGARLMKETATKGSDSNPPVQGWAVDVDVYSTEERGLADVEDIYTALFNADPSINRVEVNTVHKDPIGDGDIMDTVIDRGGELKITAQFDSAGNEVNNVPLSDDSQ